MDYLLLFRAGISFFLLGISLVSFLIAGLCKEWSLQLFRYIHSFSAGAILGIGFLFSSQTGDVGDFFLASTMLAAFSFIVLLVVDNFATSSFDYAAMPNHADEDIEIGLELSDVSSTNGEDDDDNDLLLDISFPHGKGLKLFPMIILSFASLSDFIAGAYYSAHKENNLALFFVIAFHKSLMACVFGMILETPTPTPRNLFTLYMLLFCFSSPFGILLGAIIMKIGIASVEVLSILKMCKLFIYSLAAGLYLYVAIMQMIPLTFGMRSKSDQHNVGVKTVKFAAFLTGFVSAIVPALLLLLPEADNYK